MITEKLFEYLGKYVSSMEREIPGFISLSVVNISTGETLISRMKTGGIENSEEVLELNKLQTSTVKYALKGLDYIHDLRTKRFEDIIITLDEQVHVLMTSNLQSFMAYIVIDANTGNLALTQTLHKKYYAKYVSDAISELGEENLKKHAFFQPRDITAIEQPQIELEKKQNPVEKKKNSFLHDLFFSN